ncbi:MAG: hypothetical protein COT85_01000 [Chlamydiae bacterium CG10_big_fil_rev_8_21_14_0_10_42_34]|nr:MAG: hypothetical protein COT85_01000 [Chlamydiae bacterium CG10_big_fil_rev_8_21_14_0_10_42_34]
MRQKQKNRKILTGCFALSLFFHVLAVVFFQRYTLWFSSPQKVGEQNQCLSLVDKKARDEILKVAFEPIASEIIQKETAIEPQQEKIAAFILRSKVQFPDNESSNIFQSPFSLPANSFLASKPIFPTFTVPIESFNLLDHLPKDLIVPVPAKQPPIAFNPMPTQSKLQLSAKSPTVLETIPSAMITQAEPTDLFLTEEHIAAKTPAMIPIPNLSKLPTLDELETSSYSDSFDADLTFFPKDDGSGYIFALTLIPQPQLELSRIRQHITFLIDRANSIQQGRLTATKAAVHKALAELNPEDTFNIIAFDSKMEKMSPNSLPCVRSSFAVAEEFLEKIHLGSFFSTSDLYRPLFLTVPGHVENDEIYTAILLTDAETLNKKGAQRSILQDWTQYNNGKVALYAIGMNNDHNLATLDAATAFNRGKLLNSPTNRGLKRKLLKLIKTIQNPVAKNVSCNAISRSPQSKITLFPQSFQTSNLFIDQPFVILGETETLDDFILFVQGRLKNRWLNIKKTISFLNAKKGTRSLKQEWAVQKSYHLYQNYLNDNDPKHIVEAEAILDPYDQQVIFQ